MELEHHRELLHKEDFSSNFNFYLFVTHFDDELGSMKVCPNENKK